jgi:hypothetical protein
MGSTKEEHKQILIRALHAVIEKLSGDNAIQILDCTVLGLKTLSEAEQYCFIESIGAVQDEWLMRIGEAAVALLRKKLEKLERNG